MSRRFYRRGVEEVSFVTLIEAIVIAALMLLMIFFGYRVYQALFGPDKASLNTFNLIADNVNSMLKDPRLEQSQSFLFTFNAKHNFEGTIFAVGSDGRVADPFAPRYQHYKFDDVPELKDPKFKPAMIDWACAGTACICYSKIALDNPTPANKYSLLSGSKTCRSFKTPENVTKVTFMDMWGDYNTKEETKYKSVHVDKLVGNKEAQIKIYMGDVSS